VTLLQLEYFVAAVEHGSFSAAAAALHVAQPSLSEQIRRLEDRLGVVLFVRTNRRLVLTEAGQLLLPRARSVLEAAEGVADAVRDGRLEAGLVALPVDTQGLDVTRPVWTTEVVYASADPAPVAGPVDIHRLATVPLVLPEARWGDADPTRRQLSDRARRAGVSIEPAIEVELPAAAVALAARGVADAVVSRSLLAAAEQGSGLGWAPLDPPMFETFAFVTRTGSGLSPATQEMIRMAAELLRRT
jgi:DNA-binding transcriptional LysR family regulator